MNDAPLALVISNNSCETNCNMYKRTKQTKIDKQYCDQYKNNTTIDIGKTKDRYRFDRDALTGYWRCLKAGLALRKKKWYSRFSLNGHFCKTDT